MVEDLLMVEDEDQFEAFEEEELEVYSVTLQQYSIPGSEKFLKMKYSIPIGDIRFHAWSQVMVFCEILSCCYMLEAFVGDEDEEGGALCWR